MNALQTALKRLYYKIPKRILEVGFLEQDPRLNRMTSLDSRIMVNVIRGRVLMDINLVGGIEIRIPLSKCDLVAVDNNIYTISVPKTVTNGKSIVSVLSLLANNIYTQDAIVGGNLVNYGSLSMSPIMSAGLNMMNAMSTEYIAQTSRLELLGENLILVQEPSITLVEGLLKVKVANSANLENINPRNYIAFSELVTLAVKSYIYNNVIIELDRGYIVGGQELSIIKDKIEEYADAESMYEEYLTTKWAKIALLNDRTSLAGKIKAMIPTTA